MISTGVGWLIKMINMERVCENGKQDTGDQHGKGGQQDRGEPEPKCATCLYQQ